MAVLGVIASVIGAFYYIRIVYYMYFGEDAEPLDQSQSRILWGVLMTSAVIMIAGIATTFGVEGFATTAADALVN